MMAMRLPNRHLIPFLSILLCLEILQGQLGEASSADAPTVSKVGTKMSDNPAQTSRTGIIFSDLDGTLIHYPETMDAVREVNENGSEIIQLPPSATGMRGLISHRTLAKCQALRRRGIKLVLMSGMRTSTLLKRIPFLPRADAYCTESGGRIFYPVDVTGELAFVPFRYEGADNEELRPFSLEEDTQWRALIEKEEHAGKDGYPGNEIVVTQEAQVPVKDRRSVLWDFAKSLEEMGFVLDTNSYSTCFRVNRKQQSDLMLKKFDELLSGGICHPPQLSTSTNLGCIDFYPRCSGKRNCCSFIATHRFGNHVTDLSQRSVCLCDDDNDIEMALACSHAFIPALSSDSMKQIIEKNPTHFSVTFSSSTSGTAATEAALDLIMDMVSVR